MMATKSSPGVDSENNTPLQSAEVISLVAHELKNPLVSIRGYTELLLSGAVGELNPQQCNFLRTILSNSDRMSELISDLLDASRLDSGRQKMEMSAVDAD
jgi:signal transduction histidine kinase